MPLSDNGKDIQLLDYLGYDFTVLTYNLPKGSVNLNTSYDVKIIHVGGSGSNNEEYDFIDSKGEFVKRYGVGTEVGMS